MANNLAKHGYPLVIFDISDTATKNLASNNKNVKIAKTPKEVAAQADQIVTMLPSSPHVQQVYGSGMEYHLVKQVIRNVLTLFQHREWNLGSCEGKFFVD